MARRKRLTRSEKEGDWTVEISDAPITPDGQYVAKATRKNLNKLLIKYAYGFSPKEAETKINELIGLYR